MLVDPWHLVWLIVSAMCAAVAVLYVGTTFLGLFVGTSGALHRRRTRRERARAAAEGRALLKKRLQQDSGVDK
jgi:hypothetical protein